MLLRLKSPRIENELVRTCQEMLNFLGFRYTIKSTAGQTVSRPLLEDGIYGEETDKVVIHFQRSEGLLRDGIVGPNTMQALEKAWTERHLELDSPGMAAVDGMPVRHTFVRVVADPCGQGVALHQFHDEVVDTVLLANIVERADVRVVMAADGTGFTLEASKQMRVAGEMFGKDFDGDSAVQERVDGGVHFSHTAGTKLVVDCVWA